MKSKLTTWNISNEQILRDYNDLLYSKKYNFYTYKNTYNIEEYAKCSFDERLDVIRWDCEEDNIQ